MQYTKENFECNNGALTIRGYLLKPQSSGKLPAAIVSHGFASSTRETQRYAKRFAQAGYATVYYDFCGSGKGRSDGSSTDMSVLTEKQDLSAVLDKVLALDFVDRFQVILVGCSQGGLVSALLAAERQDDVSKLVLYYPALCIPDDARRGSMLGGKFDPQQVPESFTVLFVKLGSKYALDAQKLDPFKEICTYSGPVLICHGTRDRVVDMALVQRAAREYADAKLVVIQGGDHGFMLRGFNRAMRATFCFLQPPEA